MLVCELSCFELIFLFTGLDDDFGRVRRLGFGSCRFLFSEGLRYAVSLFMESDFRNERTVLVLVLVSVVFKWL